MIHIIDFDNTFMFTTEGLKKSYQKASEIVFNKNIFTDKIWEQNHGNTIMRILDKMNLTEYCDDIKNEKYKIYPNEYYDVIKPNVPFIRALFDKTTMPWDKFIICSNTQEEVIEDILDHFQLTNYIDMIVGRDTYVNTECKPSISMYESILFEDDIQSALKIEPNIICYDDSDFGLKACFDFQKKYKGEYNIGVVDIKKLETRGYI